MATSVPDPERLHVILCEPEIAGNTGAIGRTCVALGAKLWLVRPLGFQMTDRHIKRAGLDYWPYLDWTMVDALGEVAAALGRDRLWSFSTKAELGLHLGPVRPRRRPCVWPRESGIGRLVAGRTPRSRRPDPDPPRGPEP